MAKRTPQCNGTALTQQQCAVRACRTKSGCWDLRWTPEPSLFIGNGQKWTLSWAAQKPSLEEPRRARNPQISPQTAEFWLGVRGDWFLECTRNCHPRNPDSETPSSSLPKGKIPCKTSPAESDVRSVALIQKTYHGVKTLSYVKSAQHAQLLALPSSYIQK